MTGTDEQGTAVSSRQLSTASWTGASEDRELSEAQKSGLIINCWMLFKFRGCQLMRRSSSDKILTLASSGHFVPWHNAASSAVYTRLTVQQLYACFVGNITCHWLF